MGTQQLLLIIVGVIVIGVIIAAGITLFQDHAAATNRDAIANDLVHAATVAQVYWRKPKIMGGGGSSFVGFNLRTAFLTLANEDANFDINGAATDSTITLEGVGHEPGYDDTEPVKVVVVVHPTVTDLNEVN